MERSEYNQMVVLILQTLTPLVDFQESGRSQVCDDVHNVCVLFCNKC